MTTAARNALLDELTDDVAALVLAHNRESEARHLARPAPQHAPASRSSAR